MEKYKNMKILAVLSIVLLTVLSGCIEKEKTITNPGEDIKISEGSGPDWCKAGMKVISTGPNGEQALFEIKGIVDYKDNEEVCLLEWTSNEGSVEKYFNKDHSYYVAIVKDKSGKVVNISDMSRDQNSENITI